MLEEDCVTNLDYFYIKTLAENSRVSSACLNVFPHFS